jgi:adenosylcobinamide-GDP ribazoletransferase
LLSNENQSWYVVLLLFISYHAIARFAAVNVIFTSQYTRDDETSKVKPIAKTHGAQEVIGAYLFGLAPLGVLAYFNLKFAIALLPLLLLVFISKRYFEKWIDGYTGDCLGAVEQLGECICILTYVALWKFM